MRVSIINIILPTLVIFQNDNFFSICIEYVCERIPMIKNPKLLVLFAQIESLSLNPT